MPPTGTLLSPTGKQTVYSNITSVFPPRTPETVPNAALAAFAGRVVDSYLAERAARYTAGADAAWTELKQLERTDCRLRAARETA